MKKFKYFMIMAIGALAFACTPEPIGQQPIDNVPPGPVSDVTVVNTPGGAVVSYKLPQDEDLLYVKAVYFLKEGVQSESRSSMYNDTLSIAGFGDTNEREVTLVAVDRSRNESAPVKITIKPLVPLVFAIGESITLIEDFGGVQANWDNPFRAEISVVILKEDSNKEFVPIETFYSSTIKGEGAKRGMDTIPSNFAIYAQDRWGNTSEIKKFTLKPLFEVKFDRLKFKEVSLPNDEKMGWGWVMPNIWDGIVGDQGFHTTTGKWPQSFTFDMGVTAKISRIIQWQRQGNWIYNHGNLKEFEVWGCETLDPTGNWDSWTKLMTCTSIKPSGLPTGQVSAEDKAWAAAGEEFSNSPLNPKVRYLRINVLENWSAGSFIHLSEIQVFGDNR